MGLYINNTRVAIRPIMLRIGVGILVSFYFFPIDFSFLPKAVNTKMMLAVVGAVLLIVKWIQERRPEISQSLLGAMGLAFLFSITCLLATDISHTNDYAYATYFVSFFTWLGGAFTVCHAIRKLHKKVDFRLITIYLAAVGFSQCVAAMLIDNILSFQEFVDHYVRQGQEFYTKVNRLYGIGAALDPAGVRFSLTLVLIAVLLCEDKDVRNSRTSIFLLLVAFFTITVIGNIISRTTIFGVLGGIAYIIIASGLFRAVIPYHSVKFGLWFGGMLFTAVLISAYLYQTNDVFHGHMRFAFEGFFNWVEKGEWRTDSTDKLNRVMWIWPKDTRTWVIGTGLFDDFIYGTDIGYCRFILYCGLTGFSFFALLFLYLPISFMNRFPGYRLLFVLLLGLGFLFWVKVATDIFQIYAMFFCLDSMSVEPLELKEEHEDSLQYSGDM